MCQSSPAVIPTPDPTPQIIEVRVKGNLAWRRLVRWIFVGIIVGIPVGVLYGMCRRWGVPIIARGGGIVIGLTVALVMLLVMPPWQRRRRARAIADLVNEDLTDPAELLRRLAEKPRTLNIMTDIGVGVEALRHAGRSGMVLRLCRDDARTPIEPLCVPFEPQRLDESDPNMLHLQALARATTDGDGTSNAVVTDDEDEAVKRLVKRNIKLKGGWIVIVLFGINVVVYGLKSIVEGAIDWLFVLWSLLLLLTLFGPVGSSIGARGQCFAVPGALAIRKQQRSSGGWKLRLLTRADSVLCVYQLTRGQWGLTLADGETCEHTIGTQREIEFALQAWFSPLSPPPLEQLSDLT